ncbi:hypothetical protein NDU88_007003 [Pleurodeles waltl]|uniref:Uncharacterized protein n=1 Tax=Pleurodeles waltl TaxID=8319 RepID=A0AAV7SR86_PLEWA|nr:hypothetical protein NDU88_007003 [Pleurodeles waltl]
MTSLTCSPFPFPHLLEAVSRRDLKVFPDDVVQAAREALSRLRNERWLSEVAVVILSDVTEAERRCQLTASTGLAHAQCATGGCARPGWCIRSSRGRLTARGPVTAPA